MNDFQFNWRNQTPQTLNNNQAQMSMLGMNQPAATNPSLSLGMMTAGKEVGPEYEQMKQRGYDDFNWDNMHSPELNNLKTQLSNLEAERAKLVEEKSKLKSYLDPDKKNAMMEANRARRFRKDNESLMQYRWRKDREAQAAQSNDILNAENKAEWYRRTENLLKAYRAAAQNGATKAELDAIENQWKLLQQEGINKGWTTGASSLNEVVTPEMEAKKQAEEDYKNYLYDMYNTVQGVKGGDNNIQALRDQIIADPRLTPEDKFKLLERAELKTQRMATRESVKSAVAGAQGGIAGEKVKDAENKSKAQQYVGKKLKSLQWDQIPAEVKAFLTRDGQGNIKLK